MTSHIKNLAAAIAFTVLLLVAAPPAVGQSVLPASDWAEFKSCQRRLLPTAHRISAEPSMQAISPNLVPFMTIPVVATSEEPDRPWWQLALQYGAFMTSECLIAWRVGLSLRGIESGTGIPKEANAEAKRNINDDAPGPGDRG